ncbi:diguanylate cyclase domain-containing protein [Pseudocolwellia sp. HL-MZ19]|uniref:diguanylate cyclase domain-containing protein n=1 Tax=unclassified Pseudocolwellia TaxID=2848178 RepID=UPI003CEC2696
MTKIELLQKDDLLMAIKLAKFYEKRLPDFRIEERIRFKKLQAELYSDQTEYNLAEAIANEGLELTKQLTHPSIDMAELLNIRGFAAERRGDYKAALLDYMAALEIAESLDDRKVAIHTLTNLGAIYYVQDKYEYSIIVLNDALIQAQNLNDDETLGLVYMELGILYSYLKLDNKAVEFNDKALYYFKKADKLHKATMTLLRISAAHYLKSKQYLKAIEFYQKVIVFAKKSGNISDLFHTYSKLAEVYIKKTSSEPETAYSYIILAEKYSEFVNGAGWELFFIVNKADVLNHLERYQEGLELITRAESMLPLEPLDIQIYTTLDILRIKSDLFYNQGLYQKAYQTQNQYHENILAINSRNNLYALEGLRIEYESKQHEIQAKILENKRLVQSLALKEVNENYQERTFFITICIFTMLSLAWFYSINLKNRKKLLESRGSDHLTDIPNRQNILLAGSREYNQAVNNEFSVMIIKIDNFTNINQVKGYEVGNNILIEISLIILKLVGESALCGRYSSNEFIVFLPHCSAAKAESVANGIHNSIYRKSWEKYGLKVVSVSIGMSNKGSASYESLIKETKALKQQAVTSGGNTVCIS